jgi:hypothetical protein
MRARTSCSTCAPWRPLRAPYTRLAQLFSSALRVRQCVPIGTDGLRLQQSSACASLVHGQLGVWTTRSLFVLDSVTFGSANEAHRSVSISILIAKTFGPTIFTRPESGRNIAIFSCSTSSKPDHKESDKASQFQLLFRGRSSGHALRIAS